MNITQRIIAARAAIAHAQGALSVASDLDRHEIHVGDMVSIPGRVGRWKVRTLKRSFHRDFVFKVCIEPAGDGAALTDNDLYPDRLIVEDRLLTVLDRGREVLDAGELTDKDLADISGAKVPEGAPVFDDEG
jgi:hypothetical protein